MVMATLSLSELENQQICSTDDLKRDYSLSLTVCDDQLELIPPAELDAKVKALVARFAISETKIKDIYYALVMGHVILEGPPGTGKTSLSMEIAKSLFNVRLLSATANSEWTVYDLVGRKTIEVVNGQEQVVPEDGHLTRAVVECCAAVSRHETDKSAPQAVWLLIDELNRCKIDRAFGEYFTALSGGGSEPLMLPHQIPQNRQLFIPKRFRIIGAMNSVDKTFVNSFSQAFARRFSFVPLNVPNTPGLQKAEAAITTDLAFDHVSKVTGHTVQDVKAALSNEAINALDTINKLFSLLREGQGDCPSLCQIGTAQMIDAKEMYIMRCFLDGSTDYLAHLNWAISIKVMRQIDIDLIPEDRLDDFIKKFPTSLSNDLKGALDIVCAQWGLYN